MTLFWRLWVNCALKQTQNVQSSSRQAWRRYSAPSCQRTKSTYFPMAGSLPSSHGTVAQLQYPFIFVTIITSIIPWCFIKPYKSIKFYLNPLPVISTLTAIKMTGNLEDAYIAKETPMTLYLNIHMALDQLRVQAEANGEPGPKVLIVGPDDVGK